MADYYILKVRSGRELVVHDLICADPVLRREGAGAYTPFQTKHQRLTAKRRATRQRPRPYAEPVMGGWMFVTLPTTAALARLLQLIEARAYLYGLLTRTDAHTGEPVPLMVRSADMADMRKANGRSYDPKRDSRKNLQRIYAQSTVDIPELSAGEVVRMVQGAWAGMDFVVTEVAPELAKLKVVVFGAEREVTARREDLRKVG